MLKGVESALPTSNIQDGAIYYCTDSRNAFLGTSTNLEFFLSGVGKRFKDSNGALKGEIFNDYENNAATGAFSFSAGSGTNASGDYSVALNNGTEASHSYSTALGLGTKTMTNNSLVIGKYNLVDETKNFLFTIGSGTSDNSRVNVFTVDASGNVIVSSSITASSINTTSASFKSIYLLDNSNNQVISCSMDTESSVNIVIGGGTAENPISGVVNLKGTLSVSDKSTLSSLEVTGETTLIGTTKIQSGGAGTATLVGPSADRTFYFNSGGGRFVTLSSTSGGAGGYSTPVYITSSGQISLCNTYAGGTAITLNSTSKSGSSASFYAPTTSGTLGQYLRSYDAGSAPVWSNVIAIQVLDADPTAPEVGQMWIVNAS